LVRRPVYGTKYVRFSLGRTGAAGNLFHLFYR